MVNKLRIKIILCLSLLVLVSCDDSEKARLEAQNKVKISLQKRQTVQRMENEERVQKQEEKFKREEKARKEKEIEDARKNPLKKYISDEIYDEGKKIFYEREQYMFTINKSEFSEKIESLEEQIRNKFKVSMLMTHQGITSAILHYDDEGKDIRTVVRNSKIIKVGEEIYYLKTFKDKVQIKKGENPLVISLYSRER